MCYDETSNLNAILKEHCKSARNQLINVTKRNNLPTRSNKDSRKASIIHKIKHNQNTVDTYLASLKENV